MVANKMGLLRRTANWNLWYMNVDLDLDFGCSLLFLFYVYGWETWHLTNFCVFNRFGYRARWTSAYVLSLHCYILSSCEQTPSWHLQHYRGSSKVDCRSNRSSFLVSRWEKELRFHTSFIDDHISSSCGDVQLSLAIFVVCFFALRLPN